MTDKKDTNPKDAMGIAKAPMSTTSEVVLHELGLVMMEGALKYGRHNYRESGVRSSVYTDAAKRHISQYIEGEDLDPLSGMPHVVHAMACCMVLRDSQIQGNWIDDRPPPSPKGWMEELNAKAKALLEKYPNPVPAVTAQSLEREPEVEQIPADVVLGDFLAWLREAHITADPHDTRAVAREYIALDRSGLS